MNWLKRRLRIWAFSFDANENASQSRIAITSEGESLSTEPLRLSVYRANGGTIVETRFYDRQKDRSQNQLHIVGNDEDLGRSLSKIITMESLRG